MEYQNNYQNPYQQNDGAFGWDDEIQQDDAFVLLPDGDYPFRVAKVEKARHEGSEKISACPKAVVDFIITTPDGKEVTVTENFLLHKKMEWKLSQFFASIGMKKKDEKLRMNWSPDIIGKTGVCRIIIHDYTDKKGNDKECNRIDKLYPSYDQPTLLSPVQQTYQSPATGWNPGRF